MPPSPINMANISAALAARSGLGNGVPMPVGAQMTAPSGPLPTGGPNAPGPAAPPMPIPGNPPAASPDPRLGGPNPTQQMAGVGQAAQSPVMDPETREIAKTLVMKLMKHL